jgi:hypothetical protein
MAHPQAAVGGTASNMEGSCEYLISSREERTRIGPIAWELGEVLTTPQRETGYVTKHEHLLRVWTVTLVQPKQRMMDLGFCTWNLSSLYRSGSLRAAAAARELARYK